MNDLIYDALDEFLLRAGELLGDDLISAYCLGSAADGDFHIGYSDLDFFIVSGHPITQEEFSGFHALYQKYRQEKNPYLSVLEGEVVWKGALSNRGAGKVIYWGTKGDQFNDSWGLRTFSLEQLIQRGVLLLGQDVRGELPIPTREEMLEDVEGLLTVAREQAAIPNESIHAVDWFFLLAQSAYYLRTGLVTGKTAAARFALARGQVSCRSTLERAMELRLDPDLIHTRGIQLWLPTVGPAVLAVCNHVEVLLEEARG